MGHLQFSRDNRKIKTVRAIYVKEASENMECDLRRINFSDILLSGPPLQILLFYVYAQDSTRVV